MPSTDRPAQRRKTEPSSRQQQQSTHASVSPNKQQPSSIPSNILDHIMSFVSTSPSVLNNLSRANKELYLKAIPFLYRTLKLNATNITRTFHGIKNSLDMESDDDVTRPKPTTFGTDLLSIHRRKVYCLQHTRTLIIDDWPGARAAAIALGLTQTIANTRLKDLTQNCWKWNVSEQPPRHWFDLPDTAKNAKQDPHRHHLKIFQRVERISIGQELLSSKLFVPEGYHADDDKMAVHPVIRTLLWALTPRHLCLDHLGLCKEDPMALLFMYPYKRKDRNFRRLIDQWQLKSLSWHTIPYHHLSPPIAGHPFLIQIFCNSCEGKGFKPDVGCINYGSSSVSIYLVTARSQQMQSNAAGKLVHKSDQRDKEVDKMIAKWGFGDNTMNIALKEDTEPCICCGGY
ncbi:hypothetical protein IAT40_004293 [Kwoniella sp. CBS 6097]